MHPARLLRTTGFRLALLYAGLFGLSVLVLFGVIYWITGNALRQQLATNVQAEVAALLGETGGLSHMAEDINQRLAAGTTPSIYYLLLDARGRKVAGDLAVPLPRDGWQELPVPPARSPDFDADPDDSEHHLMALGTTLPDGAFLLVGADTYRIVELEEAIIQAFGWAFGVTVLLGALGGAVLSFGFLHRIDAINRTSQAIVAGRLADRIPTRGTGDELDRLALNLNDMLDRVQTLMESLRQVSSDIAHDLRTPLSRLRQRLEDARVNAQSAEDYRAAMEQALADTDAILATFSALLRIAQIEAGTRKAAFADVDLSGILRSIAEAYEAVAEDRGQSLVTTIGPDIHVQGDRELLTQMFANLVENAMRHAPAGTRIELVLKDGGNGPVAEVRDTGPGIPAEMRDKVFQRFFRLEQSRSTPGSGLGLSLVSAVAEIHGIKVALADHKPGLIVALVFQPRG